jgi:hypothetical protein
MIYFGFWIEEKLVRRMGNLARRLLFRDRARTDMIVHPTSASSIQNSKSGWPPTLGLVKIDTMKRLLITAALLLAAPCLTIAQDPPQETGPVEPATT